jgi:hypothetical protein
MKWKIILNITLLFIFSINNKANAGWGDVVDKRKIRKE